MDLETKANRQVTGRVSSTLSITLYMVGLLLAMLMTVLSLWPDLEASLFNPGLAGVVAQDRLRTLRCPLFIAPDEESTISATFSNPRERPVRYSVRATFSEGFVILMRQVDHQVDLDVGEEEEVSWPIFAEDAAYDRIIMARVFFPRVSGIEGQQGACGVLLLPFSFGLTGNQVAIAGVALSLLSMGIGGGWWWWQKRPFSGRTKEWTRAFAVLGALVLVSLLLSLSGRWAITILILAMIILFLGAMLEHFYFSKL